MLCSAILNVFVYALSVVSIAGISSSDLTILDKQIDKARSMLSSGELPSSENCAEKATTWRSLGMLLQTKDVHQHKGGGALRPESYQAFTNAIVCNNGRDSGLSYQIHQHRGILLKMMGRGDEAISDHDEALKVAATTIERVNSMYHKANALVMLGRISEAVDLYKRALQITPCDTSIYHALVQCYMEKHMLNKTEWGNLLTTIEKSIVCEGNSNDHDDDDDDNNEGRQPRDSSGFFALYEVKADVQHLQTIISLAVLFYFMFMPFGFACVLLRRGHAIAGLGGQQGRTK